MDYVILAMALIGFLASFYDGGISAKSGNIAGVVWNLFFVVMCGIAVADYVKSLGLL